MPRAQSPATTPTGMTAVLGGDAEEVQAALAQLGLIAEQPVEPAYDEATERAVRLSAQQRCVVGHPHEHVAARRHRR